MVNAPASAMVLATLRRLVERAVERTTRSFALERVACVVVFLVLAGSPLTMPGVALYRRSPIRVFAAARTRACGNTLGAVGLLYHSCYVCCQRAMFNGRGLYTMAGRRMSASTLLSGISPNARRTPRVALNVACVHVGSSSQADYHKRNSAMDDSIGGS
jgi:hypothetical protein